MKTPARTLFLRSFLVQGSWNPRTMLGGGVAWALAPLIRHLPESRRSEAAARAGEHFNAHPYLAGVALGAGARLEEEGAEGELILRFREAIRGPLGALGDGAIWMGLRPVSILLALALALLGLPPLAVVAVFLLVYNIPHLALRWWGVRMGLALGRGVGDGLRRLDLPRHTRRGTRIGIFLLGFVFGSLAFLGAGAASTVPVWAGGIPALLLFGWGWARGSAVRPLISWVALALVGALFLVGAPATPDALP